MSEGATGRPRFSPALERFSRSDAARARPAETDVVALGIALAAIILFVGTGGTVMAETIRSLTGHGPGPDRMMVNALLLNIALIIFGWRRHRDLTREIAERRRAEQQAHILAQTDALTGCLNRRSIGPAIDRLFADASASGRAVAIVMLDLDRFKQINDMHGHAAGDALLVEAANRLCAALPEEALIGRLGGDEFACAIPYPTAHPERIERLVETLIEAVARPVRFRGLDIETTITAGIATRDPNDDNNAQSVLHNADIAMYHAKNRGRNRHSWFDRAMESELRFRSELENGIQRAVAANEFVPFYQKQIDLETGELTGFEMLARWTSPTLGSVSPDVFIPVAEDIGVITQLSEQLIRRALQDARNWDPKLTLSVNISPLQLRDPWFAQKLFKLLVEANFPPNRLEIEVTESCLHDNIGLVRTMITSLQNQGVRVSLDDFGTGYSSLSQLRALPFNRIKIDRSFVSTVNDSAESATIVQSIIALGDGLGLPITAEGIETKAVLERMREFGNFKGQGYLYGQPETAAETEAGLAQLNLLMEGAAPQPGPSLFRRSAPRA